MKQTLILLFFFVFQNLNGQGQDKGVIQADSIQVGFSNDWNLSKATKINSGGARIFNIQKSGYGRKCYLDTLNTSDIDSINKLLLKIRSEKTDTLYNAGCEDCGVYFIKINYRDTVIRSLVIGAGFFNNDLINLSNYLFKIKTNERNVSNSWINYEATKMIPPHQPTDLKFLPPTRKERKHYKKEFKRGLIN